MQLHDQANVSLDGHKLRVGIVAARFNEKITTEMLLATLTRLGECKVLSKNIAVVRVAGSIELPFALQKLAKSKKYDCLIAVGCVIRGDTPHFDYVCNMVQQGVLRVSLDLSIPIGFGVITTNDEQQAQARVHVGANAASAAVELALL